VAKRRGRGGVLQNHHLDLTCIGPSILTLGLELLDVVTLVLPNQLPGVLEHFLPLHPTHH
jgi:hypothetical protein